MEPINFASLLQVTSLATIIGLTQIQTAFAKQTSSRLGVAVIVKREFVDVETGEVFTASRGLRGFRLWLISKLV